MKVLNFLGIQPMYNKVERKRPTPNEKRFDFKGSPSCCGIRKPRIMVF